MMNPPGAQDPDPLIEAYESDKIFQFIHLPVHPVLMPSLSGCSAATAQTTSSRSSMRSGAVSGYDDPSDFITGFCEIDEDFQETIDLQRRAAFVKVNITRYSRRPGTPAAALKDLPERIRKDRSRVLLAEANRIYDRYNEGWIGRETTVVATEKNVPGSTVCRNPCYLNVVITEDLPFGFSGRAVITENRRHYVIGELIPSGAGQKV